MADKGIRFQIVGISTKEFATLPKYKPEDENAGIELGMSFGIGSRDAHILVVSPKIEIKSDAAGPPFIVLELQCAFRLHPEDWEQLIVEEGTHIVFPLHFVLHVSTLAVGSLRGVLHAKTEQSDMNFLLPTVDLTETVTDELRFSLEEA